MRFVSSLLVLGGCVALVVAAFAVHTAVGFAAAGVALIMVGAVLDRPPERRGR